jgi:hypothetical protein
LARMPSKSCCVIDQHLWQEAQRGLLRSAYILVSRLLYRVLSHLNIASRHSLPAAGQEHYPAETDAQPPHAGVPGAATQQLVGRPSAAPFPGGRLRCFCRGAVRTPQQGDQPARAGADTVSLPLMLHSRLLCFARVPTPDAGLLDHPLLLQSLSVNRRTHTLRLGCCAGGCKVRGRQAAASAGDSYCEGRGCHAAGANTCHMCRTDRHVISMLVLCCTGSHAAGSSCRG